MATVLDAITTALVKAGLQALGDPVQAQDGAYALSELNTMLDAWNAVKKNVYVTAFETFVITPNHQPHTIGLAANAPDWTTTIERPVKIESANLILASTSPAVNYGLYIGDAEWWANQRIPAMTSTLPTGLYYAPEWPNGKVYLWPVPTVANSVELEFWSPLSQPLTLATTFSMPPGYKDAVILTLAERLCVGVKAVDGSLANDARKARSLIQTMNSPSPLITTKDSGMSSGSRNGYSRSAFLSGSFLTKGG